MGGGGSKTAPEGENEEDELPKETENDKKDPHNKPLDVGKDFGGPCKKRKCTDILCTLLLAFAWFCMTVVGFACIPGNDLDQATGNGPALEPLRDRESAAHTASQSGS